MNDIENIGDVLTNTINELASQVTSLAPKLIGALVVLIVGYVIARIIKVVITKALAVGKIGELLDSKQIKNNLKKVGVKTGLGPVFAGVIYWLVFLTFITAAADIVGLSIVGETVDALFGYIPSVVSAIIVVVIAFLLSKLVNKTVAASLIQMQINFAGVIASIASSLIILFGLVMAVTQLGFDTDLITTNITLVIAGAVAALALALGLGSRGSVSNIISGYHGQKLYKVGQQVKIGDVKGKVTAVSNVALTIHSDGADVVIPFSKILNS